MSLGKFAFQSTLRLALGCACVWLFALHFATGNAIVDVVVGCYLLCLAILVQSRNIIPLLRVILAITLFLFSIPALYLLQVFRVRTDLSYGVPVAYRDFLIACIVAAAVGGFVGLFWGREHRLNQLVDDEQTVAERSEWAGKLIRLWMIFLAIVWLVLLPLLLYPAQGFAML